MSNVTSHEFNGALDALKTLQEEAKRKYRDHVWNGNLTNWYYDVFSYPLADNMNNRSVGGFVFLGESRTPGLVNNTDRLSAVWVACRR